MSRISAWFIALAEQSSTTLLLDVVVKATLVVLLAVLFLRLNPRGSAALRHRVWCLVFCGLVILPALCYMLPAWAVPILPARPPEAVQVASAPVTPPVAVDTDRLETVSQPVLRTDLQGAIQSKLDTLRPQAHFEPSVVDQRPAPEADAPDTVAAAPVENSNDEAEASWFSFPSTIWLLGAALASLPLVAGIVRSALLRAGARNIQDMSWIALRDQLCLRLGLKRSAQLLEVDASIIPLSCGVVRPAVVLPHAARSWNERLRRFVLLHELSHIKRHDVVFQLIARLACALYWFHPLVWYAMHRLRVERELACDDSVLAAGERPSDYAEQLLEVARRLQPLRLHAAVAMAQSNKLERRVGLLFSRARSHLPLSTWTSRLLLASAAAVVITVSVIRPTAKATDEDSIVKEEKPVALAEATQQPVEDIKPTQIAGRVVGPDGTAVREARVRVIRFNNELHGRTISSELLSETVTDRNGRFNAPTPAKSEQFATPERFLVSPAYIVATAPGYGLAWEHANAKTADAEYVLKLAPDETPIEGRILDLEGRPIAGVQVAVSSVTPTAENIEEWIARARNNPAQPPELSYYYYYSGQPGGGAPAVAYFPSQGSLDLAHPGIIGTITTDAEGRFRITGVGSRRLARLELNGAGIAKTWLNAVTHRMEPVPYPQHDPRYRLAKCFGARFDVALEPGLRVSGSVRDAATRQPLPNVGVRLWQYGEGFVSATTDAVGRYELTGLSRPAAGDRIRLRFVPSPDQPYFRTEVNVAPGGALEPIVRDVELKRAIWIRGRVVDEPSGKPVRGMVAYYPFLSNETAKDYANFDPGAMGIGDYFHYATGDDGSFQIPGLPGRGIVTAEAGDDSRYQRAHGADAIGGLRLQNSSDPQKVYYLFTADLVNSVREIDPAPGVEEFTCDIKLKPYAAHKVRLIDPDGKPLAGVTAEGRTRMSIRGLAPFGSPGSENAPHSSAVVDVLGLAEEQPRYVMFQHRGRGLAAVARLTTADFPDDRPKDIVLHPAVIISGRLLNQGGKPEAGGSVFARPILTAESESTGLAQLARALGKTAGNDGRFRIEMLPPNVKYSLSSYGRAGDRSAVSEVGPLKPGTELDLGDITLSPPKVARRDILRLVPTPAREGSASKTQSATKNDEVKQNSKQPLPMPAEDAAKDSSAQLPTPSPDTQVRRTIKSYVVDADGKRIVGAKVMAWLASSKDVVTTGKDGSFEIGLPEDTADKEELIVSAEAPGFGMGWIAAKPGVETAPIKLPPVVPITGRIVNLEGQPISGVRVTVEQITMPNGGLDGWLAGVQRGEFPATAHRRFGQHIQDQPIDKMANKPEALTAADGSFRIDGIGAERLLRVSVLGAGVAHSKFRIVTRSLKPITWQYGDHFTDLEQIYGADFTHVAQPSRPIRGVVRDAKTGEALIGVKVESDKFAGTKLSGVRDLKTTTDAQGRFELIGMPKGEGNRIVVVPSVRQPYFSRKIEIPSPAGIDPVEMTIDLHRGLWITGRVTDKVTGKPVKGANMRYMPFLINTYAQSLTKFANGDHRSLTDENGEYRLVGLPGPAVVGVGISNEVTQYRRGVGYEEIAAQYGKDENGYLKTWRNTTSPGPKWPFSMASINPKEWSEQVEVHLQLDPGLSVPVELLDAGGEPIGGVTAIGRSAYGHDYDNKFGPRFDIINLAPEETRTVIILHEMVGQGKVIQVSAKNAKDDPLSVRLEPLATITGRVVDPDGQPVAVATIRPDLLPGGDFGESLRGAVTDNDGRFRVDNVPVGCDYSLLVFPPAKVGQWLASKEVAVRPGKTTDVGDIGPKRNESEEATPNTGSEPRPPTQKPELKAHTNSVRGQVLGPDGRPAVGAHVAAIARHAVIGRGGELAPDGVVLGEATTDEQGRYQLSIAGASSKTHRDAFIVARADKTALAWQKLDVNATEVNASFDLKPAETITGRLVDIEGQSAAGVRLQVATVSATAMGQTFAREGVAFWRPKSLPAAWPQPAESDAQGRFSIGGIPADHGFFLTVEGDERFARQELALNTGMSDQRGERDGTYRPQVVKNAKSGDDFVLTLAPSQIFTGRVTYEDTGEPAPFSHLTVWASQQEYGSMVLVGGRTDAEGRYRINPHPGIRFGVTAYAPKGAAYLTRQVNHIAWTSGERTKEINVKLPRGVLVRGQVLEEGSGTPVPGASVQYHPEKANNPNDKDDILTGWQATEVSDDEGRFEIVVLRGPGRLLVRGPNGEFVLRETSNYELYNGRPAGRRNYVHGIQRIEPTSMSEPVNVTIRLQRGAKVTGELVDEEGRMPGEVSMVSRLYVHPLSLEWRGRPLEVLGGRFELSGLAPDRDYPVHFLQPKRRIGATVTLKAEAKPARIVLEPCGEATMRFVDSDGKPVAGHDTHVDMVVTPGPLAYNVGKDAPGLAADSDFISNIDRENHLWPHKSDAEGRFKLVALIPGATYRVVTHRNEQFTIAKEFQAKSRETFDLGDIVVERKDK
jgi:beta-lactamase regulating signal transducer with metallopeptidase domain/protocatechuate 3,4-dioxygenase beta subunit